MASLLILVVAAVKATRVDHFVRTLPEGYGLVLNEEATNVSQVQKQLLTIARAFVANPTMLILDGATSSVGTRTEVLIQRAMQELIQDRTSFIIAHRLSTIRESDWIRVINEGDIVEQGRHAERLAGGGFYGEMCNSQFERAEAVRTPVVAPGWATAERSSARSGRVFRRPVSSPTPGSAI